MGQAKIRLGGDDVKQVGSKKLVSSEKSPENAEDRMVHKSYYAVDFCMHNGDIGGGGVAQGLFCVAIFTSQIGCEISKL